MRSERVSAVDELEDQRGRVIFNAVDRADVGVIERRQQPRLALEASEAVVVAGDGRRQDLDGNLRCRRVSRAR